MPEKTCLAIINSLYFPIQVGGAEQSVRILAESLACKGFRIIVITLHPGTNVVRDVVNGVEVYRLPYPKWLWPYGRAPGSLLTYVIRNLKDLYSFFYRRMVFDILMEECPSVIHTNNLAGFSPSVWRAAVDYRRAVRRDDIRVVHTIRDYYMLCPSGDMPETTFERLVSPFVKVIRSRQSQIIDRVVGISDYVLRAHLDRGLLGGVASEVIPNAIDVNGSVSCESHRPGCGKTQRFAFGYFSRVEKKKGIEEYLQLARSPGLADCLFYVAGTGDEKYIKSLGMEDIDNVRYVGASEPGSFFAKIDCLLFLPSWPEPFGRVIIEAYSFGVPVVSRDIGGVSEIVRHGVTGYLCSKEDTEALISASDFKTEVKRLVPTVYEVARAFSASNCADRYLAAYGLG